MDKAERATDLAPARAFAVEFWRRTRLMVVTGLILLAAIAILTAGFVRARPYGKIGLLAWIQSVVLMAPWLLFFSLVTLGVYLNLAGLLGLLLVSTGLYIYLGRQLRRLGAADLATKRAAALTAEPAEPSLENLSSSGATGSPATSPELNPSTEPAAAVTIPPADLSAIEAIFGVNTYFRTETVPYQEGAIFRGNLRGEPAATHARLTEALNQQVGDRYRLFLVENAERRPTVVVLPRSADPPKTTPMQWLVAIALGLATVATSLETSSILQGFDLMQSPAQWGRALPIALGILSILAAHELGHWLAARRYSIRLSPPIFIPTWQIGSFGALTRFESLLPNRSVLFDIAFAGPAAGGLTSLAMLIIGLVLSHPGSLFQIPAEFFQGSVLVGTLAKVVLGSALQEPLVDVHPLTIVGWLGLVITALNLMPAGQLDGGRIVQAIYGRTTVGRTTLVTLVLLVGVSLLNPLALYWAALILILQRNLERPSLNDLTEPDDARAALGLLALFLMLATLLPLTPSLAGRLGIGS